MSDATPAEYCKFCKDTIKPGQPVYRHVSGQICCTKPGCITNISITDDGIMKKVNKKRRATVRIEPTSVEEKMVELLAPVVTKGVRDKCEKLIDEIRKEVTKQKDEVVKKLLKGIEKEVPVKTRVILDGVPGKSSLEHCDYPVLLQMLSAGLNVYVVGPAGSGKTMAAMRAAKSLEQSFSCMSVGPQTTQSHIMGYMDAKGEYIQTEFRKRYEKGGVFLFDELDAGNPSVMTCINSALSNEVCAFPDKMVKRHLKFLCIASGNTWGQGMNRIYVGRNQMDGASIDRFVYLEWNYDELLENAICSNKEWVKLVQCIRKVVDDLGIRAVISPRASIFGAALIDQGLHEEEVLNSVVFKGMGDDDRKRLCKALEEAKVSRKTPFVSADFSDVSMSEMSKEILEAQREAGIRQ